MLYLPRGLLSASAGRIAGEDDGCRSFPGLVDPRATIE